jgi:hypothetical protein
MHSKRLSARRDKLLGGAGTHFALSSSFFTDVRVIGVVGNDFTDEEWDVFRRHNINTDDIEVVADGKTFFWRGRYDYDLNTAHTLETQLNVFETFQPKLSENRKRRDRFSGEHFADAAKRSARAVHGCRNSWRWTR